MDTAKKIREVRKNLGLTQAEFAELVDATQGSVSKWETGRETPRYDALVKIAKAANISMSAAMTGTEHTFNRREPTMAVTLVGAVQSGYYVENSYWDDDDMVELSIPAYSGIERFASEAYIVKGMARYPDFPPGTVLVVATDEDIDFENGDYVVSRTRQEEGLYEVQVRRVALGSGDEIHLLSVEGGDGAFRPPELSTRARSARNELSILGLIVTVIRPYANELRLIALPDQF